MIINYLTIIPARSGSKGIKNKNIMKINHKHLFNYVAELAEYNNKIDGIILSTDSQEYLDIFNTLNLKKNITGNYLRNKDVASDNSTCEQYIDELLIYLKKNDILVKNIIILQSTNPLTCNQDLTDCINKYETCDNKIIVSVSKPLQHLGCMIDIQDNDFNYITKYEGSNRQNYNTNPYFINGNIYITSVEEYEKNKNLNPFMVKGKTNFFYQNINSGFQIDYYNDVYLVENVLTNSFLNKGWEVHRNILDSNDIKFIYEQIELYLSNHKDKMEKYDINMTENNLINSIHCLHKFDNTFIDFFNNKTNLNKIVNRLLNEEVEITNIEAFLKPAGSGREVPIHQDNKLFCVEDAKSFTAWIALDEIDSSNGGLKVWTNSNNLGLLKHRPSMMLGTSQTVDESEYDKFGIDSYIINKLKPGDIQYHHCLTIHGSDPNISDKKRNVITVQYKAKNSSFDQKRLKEYRDEVIRQQSILKK